MTHTTVQQAAIVAADTGAIGAAGHISFYTGSDPGADNAPTGTLLGSIVLGNPAFAGGPPVALQGVPLSVTAVATGTIGYARLTGSTSNNVVQALTVGTSGANINFNTLSVTSGQTITITSLTLAAPA